MNKFSTVDLVSMVILSYTIADTRVAKTTILQQALWLRLLPRCYVGQPTSASPQTQHGLVGPFSPNCNPQAKPVEAKKKSKATFNTNRNKRRRRALCEPDDNGFYLVPSDMPEDALPQEKKRGKFSYTLQGTLVDGISPARIEVQLRNQSFYVRQCQGGIAMKGCAGFAWNKFEGLSAWSAATAQSGFYGCRESDHEQGMQSNALLLVGDQASAAATK